jgi:hypothetical protein
MLIETPYKVGDTVSLKLNTGEELVARLEEETGPTYLLHKPMVLVAGQQGLGLAPFMFSVNPDSKFKINANHVTCILKTEKELASQYTQQTTGIAVV